jgi:hypothetical protein
MGDRISERKSVRPQVSSLQTHGKLEFIIIIIIIIIIIPNFVAQSDYWGRYLTYWHSLHVSARSHRPQLKYNLKKTQHDNYFKFWLNQ